jgi:hypothetical protein
MRALRGKSFGRNLTLNQNDDDEPDRSSSSAARYSSPSSNALVDCPCNFLKPGNRCVEPSYIGFRTAFTSLSALSG